MLEPVKIDTIRDQIFVRSPYNARFVAAAKNLGGKWEMPFWIFDARDLERVRELCRKWHGSDGQIADLVTIRVTWPSDASTSRDAITIGGRPVARAFGRDTGAKLGDGVVLLEGRFTSGGSMKNWTTLALEGTTILVRDFPRSAAEGLIARDDLSYEISIEPEASPQDDPDALRAELARLRARIAEIEGILSQTVDHEGA